MTYIYMKTEPELWTVGEHDASGKWHPESDHGSPDEAAARVRYLNGGPEPQSVAAASVIEQLDAIGGGDPESAHSEADKLLLSLVSPEVAAAYGRVAARASWWAAA